MIFISYNHKDEKLVDMVVRRLELEFGRKNIFYDKWSIQPGDSISGKMNEGLEKFTTFFYFLSPNSLNSKMVDKEWQSALMKAINENLKFVPVRIAECKPPAILTDTLYIDLYGDGLDNTLSLMKAIVKGENSYKALDDIENLVATINYANPNKIVIEIKAEVFSENNPCFGILMLNDINRFEVKTKDLIFTSASGWMKGKEDGKETVFQMRTISLLRSITPQKSVKLLVQSKEEPLQFKGIIRIIGESDSEILKMQSGVVEW